MKKMLAILLALAMICALGVTAFADDADAPKDGGSKLTFTTGGEAGTYYGFGSVLAQKVRCHQHQCHGHHLRRLRCQHRCH